MHFPILSTILLTLSLPFPLPLPLALASPTPSSPTNTTTPLPRYYLKTRVIDSGKPEKDNLYVSVYHTGAGQNDITLTPTTTTIGYLNNTNQQFDLGTPDTPWAMTMGADTNYAAWEPATLNAGYGVPGFYFNTSGLQWEREEEGFAGWLVCDWWHGLPQLFWRYGYKGIEIPRTCAVVDLVAVGVGV